MTASSCCIYPGGLVGDATFDPAFRHAAAAMREAGRAASVATCSRSSPWGIHPILHQGSCPRCGWSLDQAKS